MSVESKRLIRGFDAMDFGLEVTSETRRVSPLYRLDRRRLTAFSRGLGDFYVHPNDLPCDVFTHGFFSERVDGVEMIPLDEVLLAIYRKYSAPRNVLEVVEELRGRVPEIEAAPARWRNHLAGPLAERGFRSKMDFSYGRTMTVEMEWAPAQDIGRASPCAVSLGIIEFKPQRDRTLGKGRWIKPRFDTLGMLLREELAKILKGPPIHYFSAEGMAALVAEYPWRPIALLTRKELEAAKVQFVREHPELHSDLRGLAKGMIAAGLYSEGTQQSSVKKTAAKILAEMAGQS